MSRTPRGCEYGTDRWNRSRMRHANWAGRKMGDKKTGTHISFVFCHSSFCQQPHRWQRWCTTKVSSSRRLGVTMRGGVWLRCCGWSRRTRHSRAPNAWAERGCVQRTTRSSISLSQACEPPPKPREPNPFVHRIHPPQRPSPKHPREFGIFALRSVSAAGLVRLDTTALHQCICIAVHSPPIPTLYIHAQLQSSRSSRSSQPIVSERRSSLAHGVRIGARTQ